MNNALLSCRHSFYFNVLPFCTSLISIVAGAVASLELEQCAYEDKDIVRSPEPIPIQRSCNGWPSGSIIAHLHDIIATKYSSFATLLDLEANCKIQKGNLTNIFNDFCVLE